MNIPLSPYLPENLVSRDGFTSRPASACSSPYSGSGAYLRDSSRVPRRRLFIYHMKPPCAIGSVPSSLGHAIAYRWRSLPRVHRHRASKPQGSSERVLPWQVTMDQLICASLSHTHYWYEVGMFKVPYNLPHFSQSRLPVISRNLPASVRFSSSVQYTMFYLHTSSCNSISPTVGTSSA